MKLNFRELYNRRPIFYNWLATYIVIILVFMTLSIFINMVSVNILNTSIKNANQTYLNYIKSVMEQNTRNIELLSFNIVDSNSIFRLMSMNEASEENTDELLSGAINDIKHFTYNNSFAKEIFIAFKNIDICVDSEGKYTKEIAYEAYFNKYYQSFFEWETDIFKNNSKKYMVFPDDTDSSNVIYIQPLPIYNNSLPKAAMMIILDENQMNSLLSPVSQNDVSGNIFVLNDENESIFGNMSDFVLAQISFESGPESFVDENGKSWTSFSSVAQNGWKYVFALPYEVYHHQIRLFHTVSTVLYILLMISGIFFSYWLSQKNYKPINRLLNKITDNKSDVKHFHHINEIISKIIEDKEAYSIKIEEQRKTLKSGFIHNLLINKINLTMVANNSFEEYDVDLSGKLVIIVLEVTDYGMIEENEDKAFEYIYKNTAYFALSNVFEEITAAHCTCYFCETENFHTVIMNFSDECKYESYIYDKLSYLANFMKESLHIKFNCAVSEIRQGRELLPYLYRQACDVMEYRSINGGNEILCFADTIKDKNESYEYSIDAERRIYNNILMGNHENFSQAIEEILDYNFKESHLDLYMSRLLIYEIVSTVIKAINELNLEEKILEEKRLLLLDNVFVLKNAEDIKTILNEVVTEVCILINENRKSKNVKTKSAITEIINKHYSDSNLSLKMVASKLNITPNYFSGVFKSQFGTGFSEYVLNYRITEAKKLLQGTKLTVNDIAHTTGFTNASMFIRAFKKSEGITPGQYKDNA